MSSEHIDKDSLMEHDEEIENYGDIVEEEMDEVDETICISGENIKSRKVKKTLDQLKTPRQKFNTTWVRQFPWLRAEKIDEALGICIVCQKRLVCKKSHLERHQRSFKHKRLSEGTGLETLDYEEELDNTTEFMECGKQEVPDEDSAEFMDAPYEMDEEELDPDYCVEMRPKKIITSKRVVLPITPPEKRPARKSKVVAKRPIKQQKVVIPIKVTTPKIQPAKQKPIIISAPIIKTIKTSASPPPELPLSPSPPPVLSPVQQQRIIKKQFTPKMDRDKLLKCIDRDRNELNEYYNAWIKHSPGPLGGSPLQAQMSTPKDAFDLYFESVSTTVKTFPPKLAAELKSRVSQLMAEFELRAICEQEAKDAANGSGHCHNTGADGATVLLAASEVGEAGEVPHIVYSFQPK